MLRLFWTSAFGSHAEFSRCFDPRKSLTHTLNISVILMIILKLYYVSPMFIQASCGRAFDMSGNATYISLSLREKSYL